MRPYKSNINGLRLNNSKNPSIVIRSLIRITIEQGIKVSLATIIEGRKKASRMPFVPLMVERYRHLRDNELKILPNSELLNPLGDRGKALLN